MKIFIDRIRKFRGIPVYEILGKTREHKEFFIMYREWIDGKKQCRTNLEYRNMAGYQAYGKPEPFKKATTWFSRTPGIVYRQPTEDDLAPVLELYPDFKYIIAKKTGLLTKDVFKTLKVWLDFPKMEILLNMGFQALAMDRTFLKMKEQSQKETIRYFLEHPDSKTRKDTIALKLIRGAMKYKTTPYHYYEYVKEKRWRGGIDFETFQWCNKKGISVPDYLHYMKNLQREFPERLKESYWTEFKDVHDFHKKQFHVNEEIRHREEMADMEARMEKEKAFIKATKKFKKWNGIFNGLEVYIPNKIEDVEKQAEVLHQCLIDSDYIESVIDKECILAFIRKDGIPLATAELNGKKWLNVEQFYGDEIDRDNCDPTPECEKALDMFMNKFIRKTA